MPKWWEHTKKDCGEAGFKLSGLQNQEHSIIPEIGCQMFKSNFSNIYGIIGLFAVNQLLGYESAICFMP
jgi:hypothetical protein